MDNQSTETAKEVKKKPGFLPNILLRKKIPNVVAMILFYLCLCFGNWFMSRNSVAYFIASMGNNPVVSAIFGNEIVAFLIAGVFPLVIYELGRLIAFSMFRFLGNAAVADMSYALRAFYGLGYLVYGAFSMIYFAFTPLAVYGDSIVKFLFVGGAVALYVLFEARYRLPKRFVPRAVYAFCGVYCLLNLAFAVYSLISALMV